MCEDCIKKDVCKFRNKVEKYESEEKLPEPLESGVNCKYKRTEPSNWSYTITGDYIYPSVWTNTTSSDIDYQTVTCN